MQAWPQPDQEALVKYNATRDLQVRNELLKRYLYLPKLVARRFRGRGIEYEDLVQVASLALISALDRYDAGKGVKFPAFAMPTLLGAVKNHFRDKLHMVRLPRRESELLQTMFNARERLQREQGTPPRSESLAEYMGVPLSTIYELQEANAATYMAALDAENERDKSLLAKLGKPDEALERLINRETIAPMLLKLSDIEREIVCGRFFAEKSQREVAVTLGVSQMHISRMERKILAKLRRILDE